jgi:hypothetical protein
MVRSSTSEPTFGVSNKTSTEAPTKVSRIAALHRAFCKDGNLIRTVLSIFQL